MSRNIGEVSKELVARLQKADIPSPNLDVLILFEDLFAKDRSWILAHPEQKLTNYQVNKLNKQISRREKQIPLSYIRGFSEFYGRKFKVNRHTLVPRPESETMITALKSLDLPHMPVIADVGCGSGCLGITAAYEIPKSSVDLYDIDSGALAVTRHNIHMHELHLRVSKRDLLNRPINLYDVVLANLPYVPNSFKVNKAASYEPRIALYGGADGLDIYRRLFMQISTYTWKPEFILTESLKQQHKQLGLIANKYNYREIKNDALIQVFRTY
jgi:release factor glutamine methyltransferase